GFRLHHRDQTANIDASHRWPIRPECPPACELVMMADDLAKPPVSILAMGRLSNSFPYAAGIQALLHELARAPKPIYHWSRGHNQLQRLVEWLQVRALCVVLMLLTPSNPPDADGLISLIGAFSLS